MGSTFSNPRMDVAIPGEPKGSTNQRCCRSAAPTLWHLFRSEPWLSSTAGRYGCLSCIPYGYLSLPGVCQGIPPAPHLVRGVAGTGVSEPPNLGPRPSIMYLHSPPAKLHADDQRLPGHALPFAAPPDAGAARASIYHTHFSLRPAAVCLAANINIAIVYLCDALFIPLAYLSHRRYTARDSCAC